MFTHPKCGKSWKSLQVEHCPICCESFQTTAAGDAHRIGGWTQEDVPRRCLTPEEMRAGKHRKGKPRPMTTNSYGYWTFQDRLEGGRGRARSLQNPLQAPEVPPGG